MAQWEETVSMVEISVLRGPCGLALAIGNTRVAGNVDGMGASVERKFRVNADRLRETINCHSEEETYTVIQDDAA